MSRDLTNPSVGDLAVLQCTGLSPITWGWLNMNFGAASGVMAFAADGSPNFTSVGSASGNIPSVSIPLSCMDLTMPLPMRATGNTVSVDVATTSMSGIISGDDLTLVRSALQPGVSIPWSTVTSTPTSLSAYGILDGVSVNGSYADPSWLTSFAYSKLSGAPSLATVATTGTYGDLSGKPTLGTAAAQNTTFFASAAQGTEADTACQSGVGALSVTATVMSIVASSVSLAGTMSSSDFSKLAAYPAYAARSFANAVTLTIQTVAAAANGSQVSTTRDSAVSYSASVTTTSTIGGPQSGTIVLEICSTNSSTAANWQEISRITNSQTITLAIALQSIQVNAGCVVGIVPAGYFRRLRSVATSGSPSFAYNSGQEVLL